MSPRHSRNSSSKPSMPTNLAGKLGAPFGLAQSLGRILSIRRRRTHLDGRTLGVDQLEHHLRRHEKRDCGVEPRWSKCAAHTRAPFDTAAVLAAFRDVFEPHRENRSIDPPQVTFRPEYFVALVKARLAALEAPRARIVDDQAFEWARTEYQATRRKYEQLIPRIAEDPEAVQIFFRKTPAGVVLPDTTLDDIANHACADLLTMIGIYLENVAHRDNAAQSSRSS
jgi:hypothetical protein